MSHTRFPVVVAIPARDEADDIAACLQALAAQRGARADTVVLCLNNCRDDTAGVVRHLAPSLPFAVEVLEVELPPDRACAGAARRIALDRAADLAGPAGILLTTDADSRAATGWLAANLAALDQGAEVVAGRAEIEPEGARMIPSHLHAIDARECAYAALLDEIAALLDPDPADPWPRHDEHSGASIAVTVAAYRRAGGMPPEPLGEDRAFFAALRRVDARIRHAPEPVVVVSARIIGRARGGMADTIKRRIAQVDPFLDDRLEHVPQAVRRITLRALLRSAWRAGHLDRAGVHRLSEAFALPHAAIEHVLVSRYFGAAWARAEQHSRFLQRRPVPLHELSAQTGQATRLRGALRAAQFIRPADPIDIASRDAAD